MALTLNITDKKFIEKVKSYSRKRKTSISKLFYSLMKKEMEKENVKSIVDSFAGILGPAPKNFDYKKEYREHIIKKYSR